MSNVLIAVIAALGAASAAAVTWLVARRNSSGRIDTTEADTLWKEASAMRDVLREEAAQLRAEIVTLRAETSRLCEEAAMLKTEMIAFRIRVDELRADLAASIAEVKRLRAAQPRRKAT